MRATRKTCYPESDAIELEILQLDIRSPFEKKFNTTIQLFSIPFIINSSIYGVILSCV